MALSAIPLYELPTDLPVSAVDWRPDPRRAVLLLHDLQRYFLRPFDPRQRSAIVGNAARLRRASGLPVAYTAQPGSMTVQQRGLLADFWGPGMAATESDRSIVDEVAPGPDDWRLTKWRYSAFHHTDLLERMRAAGRDQLVVAGVYAHVGILGTLLEAFANDIQPFLVADATGDFTAADHRLALDYAARRCARVLTTDQVLAELPAAVR